MTIPLPEPVPILDEDIGAYIHRDDKFYHLSNRDGVSHRSYIGEEPDHDCRRDAVEGVFKRRGFQEGGSSCVS